MSYFKHFIIIDSLLYYLGHFKGAYQTWPCDVSLPLCSIYFVLSCPRAGPCLLYPDMEPSFHTVLCQETDPESGSFTLNMLFYIPLMHFYTLIALLLVLNCDWEGFSSSREEHSSEILKLANMNWNICIVLEIRITKKHNLATLIASFKCTSL